MRNKITPINIEEFSKKMKVSNTEFGISDYYKIFENTIRMAKRFAMSSFYWFIHNNTEMKLKWVSENIHQLTPYTKEDWLNQSLQFIIEQFHVEDRSYVLAAIKFASETYQDMNNNKRKDFKFNIYARALNAHNEYTWVMIQIPDIYINKRGKIESILYIVYDLSHFRIINKPLISVIDYMSGKMMYYYKYFEQGIKEIETKFPVITDREKQILKLMGQGLNSPEIAKELFISYHTVENHKRNLRKKTNTKTSAELMVYIITYNPAFFND